MNQKTLLARLRPEIEKIDAAMHHDIAVIRDPLLHEIISYALFNGGKRIRPLLCLLAARLCGCDHEMLYRLPIAFEYLHVATLLHDDVIDHANQRRGRRTANDLWGNTPIILAGDFLHARSLYLIGSLGGRRCLETVCNATTAMVEGEFLQYHNTRNFNQSEADYFAVIEGKTALLLKAVCETGALFGGGSEAQVRALGNYGSALGIAFQIVDDILDYLGDPGKTGKAVGNDFLEGKMTLPLITALTAASEDDRQAILNALAGEQQSRRSLLTAATSFIDRHNGFAYCREQAAGRCAEAAAALDVFADPATEDFRASLLGLASYVLAREK